MNAFLIESDNAGIKLAYTTIFILSMEDYHVLAK
jgi:hypothetical protein